MMTFGEWYDSLTKSDIACWISQKVSKSERKMSWYEFFEEVAYAEYVQEELADEDYREEMAWLGRNYWKL